ncbi:hypothetical protein [Aliarcobacter cryaerophilus]|uniref:hypothetical protein n=1 Tax=Aliarcobacter cryaerophilus TaxID=28198 RepID=UPI0021B56928|nr:hypothetical protein [Aliarcobacter cryaerophilus]MCT7480950.1 hypothetical protein [Aliarcobacter cryaerophilus]
MDLKLKKKISKMSMEELNEFLDKNCKTKEDRATLLSKYNKNPYIELSEKYKDIKNLPNIILEDDREISLDFDYLKLDDDFVFEHNFKVITKDKRVYQTNICCTTKEIIYYRINEYFKEYSIIEDIKKFENKNKKEDIEIELRKLSKLKEELLSYISKQKTIYREFNQDIINRITGVYSIEIDDYQNKLYKTMLQDVRNTKKALIKKHKQNIIISKLKYHLFRDLKSHLQENYNYQKAKIQKEIENLKTGAIENDNFKYELVTKKQKLEKLQNKLKAIPKDGATRMEHFLNSYSLNLTIDSKNQSKYNTKYLFLYKIEES